MTPTKRNKGSKAPARRLKTTSVSKKKVTVATRPPNTQHKHDTLSMQVCSLVDPFCQAALGAKFPDLSSTRSMPYQFRFGTALYTDEYGNGAELFVPGWNSIMSVATAPMGTPALFSSFVAASGPTLTPDTYRVVSMGIILRNVATPMTASGLVRVRGFASQDGNAYTSVNPFTYNADFSDDTPLSATKETAVFFRRASIVSQQYIKPNAVNTATGAVSAYVGNGWDSVVISVIGGPANTNCLQIEVIVNYEITFPDSDSMQLATTPAAQDNNFVTSAASRLQGATKSVFSEGLSYAASVVERTAKRAVMAAISARFGAPLALMVD